ncbi:MAG: dehypoxanthine futalosine cyclase [Peptococcaceae bacterium]|nr:dehypoxanthine futalosine cyclase [Peptococcaceae bacterium]
MGKVAAILEKALAGTRLTLQDGVTLLAEGNLHLLGKAANIICRRKHPEGTVSFVVDRNINYTNVCRCGCLFCAFYRRESDRDAYVLSIKEILDKVQELVDVGGTQVLIQGGIHPGLGIDYFTEMFKAIKERFDVQIHSLSPPEIVYLAQKSGLSVREILETLRDAGLDSLPGGGAEILADRVRRVISPAKISWREWMNVMLTAHGLGMRTTATMMFGTIETLEERVLHLLRIRDAQDETGGFTAFIPWSYQPANTKLGGTGATAVEYLRLIAVARLFLDNIPNIQASWVTQGAKVGQLALAFGANDFGGTMLEENVVRAAGASYRVPLQEIVRIIKDAGYTPAQRTTLYDIIRTF